MGGWGVTALGMICALQYFLYMHRARSTQSACDAEVDDLQAELKRLRKENNVARVENRLLRVFVSENDVDRAVLLLLKNLIPNTDRGFAATVDVNDGVVTVGQSRGLSREARKALMVDQLILEKVAEGEPYVLSGKELRASRLAASLTATDRKLITKLYIFGIHYADQLIGLIITTSLFPVEMETEQHFSLLKQLAVRIGELHIHSVTLESHKHALNRTNDILELRAITDARFDSPVDMIEEFMSTMRVKTSATRAALYISTSSENMHRNSFVRCGAVSNPNVERQLCRAEDAIATQAHVSRKIEIYTRTELLKLGIRTFLSHAVAVPLVRKGATVGVICFSRESVNPFQESDIELAQWAADYLAGTILNALQRAQIEQQARTDSLTGMANRATFDEAITNEVAAAKESDEECSLLLMDIDHFKVTNDQFGHLVGDHVLRSAAQVVMTALEAARTNDRVLAARYGGEEFAVLLPGVNDQGAARIAEAVRKAVHEHQFKFTDQTIPTTLSIGVATLPKNGSDAHQLIAAADGALYFAKESGRNRVAMAQAAVV